MEHTNSPYERLTGLIIAFVFTSLFLFVMLAQSAVSVGMQTTIANLFSH